MSSVLQPVPAAIPGRHPVPQRKVGVADLLRVSAHGILTAGPSVESAARRCIALENACHAQQRAESAGTSTPTARDLATLTHAPIGNAGGAHHAFQSPHGTVVRQQPEVLQ